MPRTPFTTPANFTDIGTIPQDNAVPELLRSSLRNVTKSFHLMSLCPTIPLNYMKDV